MVETDRTLADQRAQEDNPAQLEPMDQETVGALLRRSKVKVGDGGTVHLNYSLATDEEQGWNMFTLRVSWPLDRNHIRDGGRLADLILARVLNLLEGEGSEG